MLSLQNKLFDCSHIKAEDLKDIQNFSVKTNSGKGLVNYLKYSAFPDERKRNMRTYLVRDNFSREVAGYFSLKAGLISIHERREQCILFRMYNNILSIYKRICGSTETDARIKNAPSFDTLPGIELANFAVNNNYILNHPGMRGLGLIFFNDFILPIVDNASYSIGARILYIFALPYDTLLQHYGNYGFRRLKEEQERKLHKRLKNNYDRSCIFMYRPI